MKNTAKKFDSGVDFEILPVTLLDEYIDRINPRIQMLFDNLKDAEISTQNFSFYTSVSSVFSSKIEGEEIELDSYIKYKRFGISFSPDYTKKIDDLYEAYSFAHTHQINKGNLEEAHKILTKHFLASHMQGKVRSQNMYVTTTDGRIEYVAAMPQEVKNEMQKLYHDISRLLDLKVTILESFYFASLLHLVFVKIHPFGDGNGRTGRLLEKWFLATKLGNKAWFIQSEKYYYDHHQDYYDKIRTIGLEYSELDYSKALSFLMMLPQSLAG